MANTFNWSLGHEGKGNVYDDGTISTWNTSGLDNHPHHLEMAGQDERKPAFKFYLSPEGGLHDGGISFQNNSPKTDDQQVAEVVAQHPAIWDGRNDDTSDLYQAEPRSEFGHAYNLMDTFNKVAKDEGWADFHTELKLPRSTRKQIRRWVDRLKWPAGAEKADIRTYHITILSMDEYDEDFAKWSKSQVQGKTFNFKSVGMAIFNDYVVLKLESPEWTELVLDWQEKADEMDLKPRKFNPPEAHVSIGKTVDGKWPQGVPDPHVKFDTRMFNINKELMWRKSTPYYPGWESMIEPEDASYLLGSGQDFYHYAPTSERNRLMRHGLQVALPQHSERPPESYQAQPVMATVAEPVDELAKWLNSFSVEQQSQPPSLHHTDADDFTPQVVAPIVQTPHIDPPSKPYAPYNWAEEGWEESPLDRIAGIKEYEDAQYPTGRTLESEAKEPEDEAEGINGDKLVYYDDSLGSSWYVVDGGDYDFISGPWSDEDEARSINKGEWSESHQSAIDMHPCPECGEDMDGRLCPICGYDGLAHPDGFKDMERSWYDRVWGKPGDQPQPTPHELHPMHWRDDHAKNISLASGKDLDDLDHSRRWIVSSEPGARESSDSMPAVWSGEQSGLKTDHNEDQSALREVRKLVSGSSSVGDWQGF